MGVPELWDVVELSAKERVPLSLQAHRFYLEHKRPMRVAIDSYIWIFETSYMGRNIPGQVLEESTVNPYKIVQGFIHRVTQLVLSNISFVFVFDGNLKPLFKRRLNFNALEVPDLLIRDQEEQFFRNFQHLYLHCNQDQEYMQNGGPSEVSLLKDVLTKMGVRYVDLAGEAESECARLQNLGIVDYVITNDSDVMLFGLTRILRNFSKKFNDSKKDEFYVTPIELEPSIDRSRLIFFAILRGADYSTGFNAVGTERAKRLAFIGTPLSKVSLSCKDFHPAFKGIFYPEGSASVTRLPDLDEVNLKYGKFVKRLEVKVSKNAVEYFGRNDKLQLSNIPPYYIALLYYYPVLKEQVFMFSTDSLNVPGLAIEQQDQLNLGGKTLIPQLKSFYTGTDGKPVLKTYHGDNFASQTSLDFNYLVSKLDQKLTNVSNVEKYLVTHLGKCLFWKYVSFVQPELVKISGSRLKIFLEDQELKSTIWETWQVDKTKFTEWWAVMYNFKYKPLQVIRHFDRYAEFNVSVYPSEEEESIWITDSNISANNLDSYRSYFEEELHEASKLTRTKSPQKNNLDSETLTRSPIKMIKNYSPNKSSVLAGPAPTTKFTLAPLNPPPTLKLSNLKSRSSNYRNLKSLPRKSPTKTMKSPSKVNKSPTKLTIGQKSISQFFKSGEITFKSPVEKSIPSEVVVISSSEEEDPEFEWPDSPTKIRHCSSSLPPSELNTNYDFETERNGNEKARDMLGDDNRDEGHSNSGVGVVRRILFEETGDRRSKNE